MREEGGGDSRIQASGLYALVSTSFLAIISFGPISSGCYYNLSCLSVQSLIALLKATELKFLIHTRGLWLKFRHNHTVSMDPFGMQLVDKPSYIWRRVLLKVSGEALADHSQNIDRKITMAIAREVASVMHFGVEASTCCRLQLCRGGGGGGHIFHGSSWALGKCFILFDVSYVIVAKDIGNFILYIGRISSFINRL
ncbi:hypothetical protein ES319_D12G001100v1 [Gossypium barbadense]|uniref:Aspartate/glutamate/uridylate kinase domain-containing protein n=1 Tax=Gossypium barbadense TaxID=3634 RepID=A0A5J5NSQ9_GOSBA|nr:hypothetical protein ES319_D12G001100v1 [Gossypium barbadense]KAB1997083.1 hypothetical protein ES319_D12G001100v1 [Gossypium barbadense]